MTENSTDAIQKFEIQIEESVLTDLKKRLEMTRWVEAETAADWSQGIPLSYMREIHHSWLHDYDWRACEKTLNNLGSYRTRIDGLDIHFFHLRSPHPDARPLIMTHGWPGSVIEFLKISPLLTDPTRHGGQAEEAFHLVLPSLPGYGFSGKPTGPGWGVAKIGQAWGELMRRLGYEHFGAQGGDWGAPISLATGRAHPDRCKGVHLNMAPVRPDDEIIANAQAEEKTALADFARHQQWGTGYSKQQSTRPQTLAYSLVDSPLGQAAWILEKFHAWSDCRGHPENIFTRTELLDNVMIYWLTASGGSSARLYWESFNKPNTDPFDLPVGVSRFPHDIIKPTRRWAARQYTNIVFWRDHETGGHFAAMERPEALARDIRDCFGEIWPGGGLA